MSAINKKAFYKALIDKGITQLFHANSVATACLFLHHNALLSRGSVQRLGYKQTPQDSDGLDKKESIWFDVFVDSVDIHDRASKKNEYGPVTFVIDTEIITNTLTGKIWATKQNPIYWTGKKDEKKWFQSIEDLEDNFTKGDFGHMIVFRHCGGELPLGNFLKKIILDDPDMNSKGIELFSMAYGALRSAMAFSGINVPIIARTCGTSCSCLKTYKANKADTLMMFDPLYNP